MKNQKGFTLIELVVVIVILGILAAVAVPKFVDMQSDARQAALEGLYGSVRSAMSLSHAQSLIDGNAALSTSTVSMEGTNNVDMVYGYPGLTGIDDSINISADFSYVPATGIFTLAGGTNCTVTYVAATSAAVPATATISTTCQ